MNQLPAGFHNRCRPGPLPRLLLALATAGAVAAETVALDQQTAASSLPPAWENLVRFAGSLFHYVSTVALAGTVATIALVNVPTESRRARRRQKRKRGQAASAAAPVVDAHRGAETSAATGAPAARAGAGLSPSCPRLSESEEPSEKSLRAVTPATTPMGERPILAPIAGPGDPREGGVASNALAVIEAGSAEPAAEASSTSPAVRRPPVSGAAEARTAPRPSWASAEMTEVERSARTVKAILNKLTADGFEGLYQQLLACGALCEARVDVAQVIARELFTKATLQQQHCFVELYVDACSRLHADLRDTSKGEVDFRRVVLDQCQESFNQHLEPPKIDQTLEYEEGYEALVKHKTQMLGNIRFIGDLLNKELLWPTVFFHCAVKLLRAGFPEALEALCALLATAGPTFDAARSDAGVPNAKLLGLKLDELFVQIELLAVDPAQPHRTRCLLKDALDLRRRQWQPRQPAAESAAGDHHS